MRHRGYNVCQVCGEAYDCGERHECPGPVEERLRPERVDKHLEACRRVGHYIQPGYKLKGTRREAGRRERGVNLERSGELRRGGFADPEHHKAEGVPPAGRRPVGG